MIDLGPNAQAGGVRRMGSGTELYLVLLFQPGSGVLAGGPMTITLQTDSVVGFGSVVDTTMTTGAKTALNAGNTGDVIILPADNSQLKEFLRLKFVAGATVTTAPTVKAFFTDSPTDWYAYADAI